MRTLLRRTRAFLLVLFLFTLTVSAVTYNPGDLFLGFHATGGTGAQQDYLVNIGPASQYQGAAGTVVTPSLGNLGADLSFVFGPNWSTRGDVLWGIFGVGLSTDPSNTLYATRVENPFGTLAQPWPRKTGSTQAGTASRMNAVANFYTTYNSTANSSVAVIQNVTDPQSYASHQPGGSNTGGGSFNGGFSPTIEGDFANTSAQSGLDLFRIVPGIGNPPSVYQGTFTINSSGQLRFAVPGGSPSPTPTPTPSPSPTVTPTPTPSPTVTPTPSPSPTATPTPVPGAQLANISSRVGVGTGDNVVIAGFIINGSGPKRVIIRALGPSIGLAGALPDPRLGLYDESGGLIVANDNWRDVQEAEISATNLAPADDRESAIVRLLNPGVYTAIMSGAGSTTGVGLVEVYDLDVTGPAKLANISTRGPVGNGPNVLIGGVIVTGSGSARVIIRGIGPSTGLPGALSNPTLELHNGNGQLIYANDNWQDSQEAAIRATNLQPLNPLESAILQTLSPGVYTAILAGAAGSTGVGLIEVYRMSP